MITDEIMASAPVVVGVDGSESALAASRWAADEAILLRAGLRLVHAVRWPRGQHFADVPVADLSEQQVRDQAGEWLVEAEQAARSVSSSVDITVELREGDPVAELVTASVDATAVVVGSRGLGGFRGLLLGSTAIGLTAKASGPVVVCRGHRSRAAAGLPIVLGLTTEDRDASAADYAFRAAAARGTRLVVVHVWHEMLVPYAHEPLLIDWSRVADAERDELTQRLESHRKLYPDLPIEFVMAHGAPARVLVERSETAQLIVVGSRGRGPLSGAVLGSTGQTLIRHAECPVAVVPDRAPMRAAQQ